MYLKGKLWFAVLWAFLLEWALIGLLWPGNHWDIQHWLLSLGLAMVIGLPFLSSHLLVDSVVNTMLSRPGTGRDRQLLVMYLNAQGGVNAKLQVMNSGADSHPWRKVLWGLLANMSCAVIPDGTNVPLLAVSITRPSSSEGGTTQWEYVLKGPDGVVLDGATGRQYGTMVDILQNLVSTLSTRVVTRCVKGSVSGMDI